MLLIVVLKVGRKEREGEKGMGNGGPRRRSD